MDGQLKWDISRGPYFTRGSLTFISIFNLFVCCNIVRILAPNVFQYFFVQEFNLKKVVHDYNYFLFYVNYVDVYITVQTR